VGSGKQLRRDPATSLIPSTFCAPPHFGFPLLLLPFPSSSLALSLYSFCFSFPAFPSQEQPEAGHRAVDISRLSLLDGTSLLSHALSSSKWDVATLLLLAGHPVSDNSNVQPLIEVYKSQLLRGEELSPEQVAVFLLVQNISPVSPCISLVL